MVTFSIITPVFNGEKFIQETIDSVLSAVKDFSHEYLVINDGSTDSTSEILSNYGSKIVNIYQQNSGQAAAISKGIEVATGNYALVVNADDPLISKNLFTDAIEILENYLEVVATYPDWQLIDEAGSVIEVLEVKEFSIEELVGRFNCLIGPGGIFRTSAAKSVGGWDKSFKYVPDYNFWLHMVDYGDFRHIPKVQATWRTHEGSISIHSRGKKMADERIRVISEYFLRHPEASIKFRNMAMANAQYRAAVLSYFDSNINGRKLLLGIIRIYPRILIEKDKRVLLFLLCLPLSRKLIQFFGKLLNVRNLEDELRRIIKS